MSGRVRELLRFHGNPPKEVYYDIENSGFVPKEVIDVMLPYFNSIGYGHPAITHKPGWEALEAIYEAKEALARTIGNVDPEEIIFTHSGTESNNLAILGYALRNRARRGKIVVSSIEHLSVVFPAQHASELLGFKAVLVPVDDNGLIDPEVFKAYVDRETVLVSIQLVNHEIGTIQRLRELVDIAKDVNPDIVFHTDAADAYGWVQVDVKKLNVDMMTISSHKIHGPRGVGALYVRSGIELESPLKGQLSVERLWPGVENIPLIAGFKKAVEITFNGFDSRIDYVRRLRDKLIKGITSTVQHTLVNGPLNEYRVANNANISFLFVEGEALTIELSLNGIYVSSGSACSSRVLEPSHVLLAIGRKHEEAHGSILFKLTRYHKEEDVDYTLEVLPKAVERLRAVSPWKP